MNLRGILTHGALVTLFLVLLLAPFGRVHGQWTIPKELQTQVSALNDEQIEFITSGSALKFIPQRQLEHELTTRDACIHNMARYIAVAPRDFSTSLRDQDFDV